MSRRREKYTGIFLSVIIIVFICVGCSGDGAVMPYGSSDYENGEWTVDELVGHLEELGFDNIDIEEDKSRSVSEVLINVRVEDTESDSWFTEYTDFVKGEPVKSWREVKIEVTYPIPVMTIETHPELVELLPLRYGSDEDIEKWEAFMKEHDGEFIEFDGTITDWYDDLWYIGISFDITFEDHEDILFYWSSISTREFGYNNDYSAGCVKEGISAHVVAKIVYSGKNGCEYELEDIELGN